MVPAILAIEAEARADAIRGLTREPGVYQRGDGSGGIEVVVDLEESTSYVRDMFPDEVERIEAEVLSVDRLTVAFHQDDHPAVPNCELPSGERYCHNRAVRLLALLTPTPEAPDDH
jgi:hypothetical protein